jgi:hypothetical protein
MSNCPFDPFVEFDAFLTHDAARHKPARPLAMTIRQQIFFIRILGSRTRLS